MRPLHCPGTSAMVHTRHRDCNLINPTVRSSAFGRTLQVLWHDFFPRSLRKSESRCVGVWQIKHRIMPCTSSKRLKFCHRVRTSSVKLGTGLASICFSVCLTVPYNISYRNTLLPYTSDEFSGLPGGCWAQAGGTSRGTPAS